MVRVKDTIILYSIFFGVVLLLGGCQFESEQSVSDSTQATPIVESTPEPTPTPVSDQQLIANALASLPDMAAGQLEVTIDQLNESFAQGTFSHNYESVADNEVFIAAKVEGEWQIIFYGDGAVECEVMNEYQVPVEFYGMCTE